MPAVRTIALMWSDFELRALETADRDEKALARIGFYSGALAMLELLGRTPPAQADALVGSFKAELTDFHAELLKGPPR